MIGRKSFGIDIVALAAIVLLIAILMAPNVAWLLNARSPASLVEGVLFPSVLLLLIFALSGNRVWIACAILTPFALLAPAEFFYVVLYGHPSTDQIIATIFATNLRETLDYFGNGLFTLLACATATLVAALIAIWRSFRSRLRWQGRGRQWIVVILLVVPVIFAAERASTTTGDTGTRMRSAWQAVTSLSGILENGYPLGTIFRFMDYRQTWNAMAQTVAARDSFRFHVTATRQRAERTVIVLVVGESSRRDRWQLFGYDKPTNPELSGISNLIAITDMVNSWSASIRAIPQLLTRKPITDNSSAWGEPSIIKAMQEAGFETWWISNQMPIGKFDSPVSMYALEAQHRMFLNHTTYTSPGGYDDVLVKPLADLLATKTDRDLFVVLHMMGSHLRYDSRYPASYKRFTPTISGTQSNVGEAVRTSNSYDNTIFYTDHVLSEIISTLNKHAEPSALWFESDHGETLPTAECWQSGHGLGDRFDFEVPAFFWFSEAYGRTHSEMIERLRANAGKRALSAGTFETLIDMGDLTYPQRDETWSLFSPSWREHTRLVNAAETLDFDNAASGKGCGVLYPRTAAEAGSH